MLVETLGSIKAELALQLGSRTDITDDRYIRWINDGMLSMAEELNSEDFATSRTLTTQADVATYLLEPDVEIIRSVSVVDTTDDIYGGQPLGEKDLTWYRQQPIATGLPEYWIPFGRNIIFWPTPDDAYSVSIDYAIALTELNADTDQVPFRPGLTTSLLLLRSRWIALDALRQPVDALVAQNQYASIIKMRLDRRAQQEAGRNLTVSVPRTERELRLGARGYRNGLR